MGPASLQWIVGLRRLDQRHSDRTSSIHRPRRAGPRSAQLGARRRAYRRRTWRTGTVHGRVACTDRVRWQVWRLPLAVHQPMANWTHNWKEKMKYWQAWMACGLLMALPA